MSETWKQIERGMSERETETDEKAIENKDK